MKDLSDYKRRAARVGSMAQAKKEGAAIGPTTGPQEGRWGVIPNGVIGAMSAFLKR